MASVEEVALACGVEACVSGARSGAAPGKRAVVAVAGRGKKGASGQVAAQSALMPRMADWWQQACARWKAGCEMKMSGRGVTER